MIYDFSTCPYCNGCVVSVNDDGPQLVVGRGAAGPCPHLSLIAAGFNVVDPARNALIVERSALWGWARGSGARRVTPGEFAWLADFIADLAAALAGRPVLKTEYEVESCCVEDLKVLVPVPRRYGRGRAQQLIGELVGWVLYSPDPAALEAEVGGLMGCSGCEVRA